MSTSTSVHSNAFNFMSFIEGQVDPRTGLYTCSIKLPELLANQLCGPVVPLHLNFNPLNGADSGFGKGWNLQLSQFNPSNGKLALYTGEVFKVNIEDENTVIPEKKIDSFHFHVLDNNRYRVEHKSGLVEILKVGQGQLAMPVQLISPQGHSVKLNYEAFGTDPLLSSINNADGSQLLTLVRTANEMKLTLHPGTACESVFVLSIIGGETQTIVLPTHDSASWRFVYRFLSGLTCLEHVYTPTAGHETVSYSGKPHYFPGLTNRSLPRVAKHTRDPGFGQPAIETRYSYGSNESGNTNDHNFLGYGSDIAWNDDGLDNLYKVKSSYEYETQEHLWDVSSDRAVRSTRRVFNRFHLILREEVRHKALLESDDTLLVTETEYYIDPLADFKDQPNYCQLPKKVTQIWRKAAYTLPRHTEVVSTTYDDFGNVLIQTNANGVMETNTWYLKEGEEGCPADPQQFVRHLKSKTVTPAHSTYGDAPTLQTRYSYKQYEGLAGNEPWLAISDETVCKDEITLQHSTVSHIEQPNNPFMHGRKLRETLTLNGNTTTTHYAYSETKNARAREPVLQTVTTLIGYDDIHDDPDRQVRKTITLEHSLLSGEPLLSRDDSDVEIAYEYDLLGRVTKETVAPHTDSVASRTYSYKLCNATGQQASQSAINVKGVETVTWLDGHHRVVKETRQDADALCGRLNAVREIYRANYNHLEQKVSETVIDWEREKDVCLTSLFNYDVWGEQCSMIRPDGIAEHEVTDPINRTTTQWVEGMGKTITSNNLFDKPDSVRRIDLGGVQISEHVYQYDGLGRTAEEVDAAGNWTRYEYDAFNRMTKTILPDSSEIIREYVAHNKEDLPIKISVNGQVLGEQAFDGLDRMTVSITGGRKSVYSFAPGQRQPKRVTRPSGNQTGYAYKPELGDEPAQRIAVESTATYEYDSQNARLLRTVELNTTLERSYFSSGELKSEHISHAGEEPYVMGYEYSLNARLLSYTDVLGQTQTYEYDDFTRLKSTRLGLLCSTFGYDAHGQLTRIETVDEAGGNTQRLCIDLEYDEFGRERKRTFDLGAGIVQTLEQTYDEVDRLIQRTLSNGSEELRDEYYNYDSRSRLCDYKCSGSQVPVDPYGKSIQCQVFGFDAVDNITFVETTFEGGRNESCYEYGNIFDPCQLTALTNSFQPDYPARLEFDYDADGNLIRDEAGRTLTYDSLGRLSSISV